MTVKNYIEKLNELDRKISSLNYAETLISWDALTLAPKKSVSGRAVALEGISGFYFSTLINEDTNDILKHLEENSDELSPIEKAKVQVYREEYDRIANIPPKEYSAYEALKTKSSVVWEEAKANNTFDSFAPYLDQVIAFNKKYIGYRDKGGHPYNTLMDDYEKHLTVEVADKFFENLQGAIVPLLKRLQDSEHQPDTNFFNQKFDIKSQDKFSRYIMEKIGFRTESGVLAESVHPFTMNIFRDDVRISTHYFEEDVLSGMSSTIHEAGHGIYEQNVAEEYGLSIIATGTSMGIHESQSRLFENNFGRSEAFWSYFFPKLKGIFPNEFKDISLEAFYKGVNYVTPSLIRTDADELTYPLHIMVRYEIEKMIFGNKVKTKDLPELWREKYKEYIGIVPETDSLGILQDVHWSEGLFGYFPSYALGSAYAAQFEHVMNQSINIDEQLRKGEFSQINAWLTNNIHKFGRTKSPDEIMLAATNEPFDSKYFIDYLTKKYTQIYNI